MIKKIQFENKVAIQNDEEVPIKNKVTDVDLNEIKETVNNNAEELENTNAKLLNKASKTELQKATLALQAELLKAQEEIERQNKDYKAGTLEGQAEGESLYLADSSDARFREFGIGGNDKQATRSGINFYNANDKLNFSDVVVVDKDDWITITGDNSSGNSLLFKNFMTKNNKNIKSNTTYYLVVEIKNIAGEGRIILASASASEVEGAIKTSVGIDFSDLSTGKKVCSVTTKENLESLNNPSLLRSYVQFKAGQSGSITFRMSLLEAEPTLSTFEYEPYGAMPSLEFSSEVKAVGQDINIFDSSIFEDIEQNGVKIKRNVDGTLTLNGTYAGTSAWNYRFNLLEPISVDKEELYLSMQKIEGNCTGQIRFTAWEQNSDNRWLSFETSQYSNLLAEKTYIRASIIIYEGATFNNLTIGLKISNKKDAIYSPYNHGSANTVVENKNKLDFSKWNNATASHGTIEQVENGIKLTATANDCYTNTFAYKFQGTLNRDKIECYGFIAKPNTKYTFSCKVNNIAISKRISMFFSDKDYNIISYVTSATSVLTATTPENCKYITIRVGVANTGDSLTFTDLQVEEGDATDYIAHEEQTVAMPVQEPMLEGDEFDWDNEEEVHTWSKVELTGNETGWFKSSTTMTNAYGIKNEKIGLPVLTENTSKCTHFKYADGVTATSTSKYISQLENLYLSFPLDIAKTLEEFKSLMQEQVDAETPVTIYYKLETPTKLPFTEAQKAVAKQIRQTLHSYKSGTHVYCTNEISPIFDVKYTIDQKAYIDAQLKPVIQELTGGN